MRSPARNLAGNLMWTHHGTVWAIWRLQALPYGYRATEDKLVARALHKALIRALPGESLLLGVCAGMDPTAVVEKMIQGIDLANCPDWAIECEATLDTLDEIGVGQRVFWLAKPLPSGVGKLAEPFKAATAGFFDLLGVPRGGPSQEEVTRRLEQAAEIAETIPQVFRPTPATEAQMIWLHLHAQQRGLFADMGLPEARGDVADQLLTPRSGSAMLEPILDEGGQSDLDRRELRSWDPLRILGNRFVKVIQPHIPGAEPIASYQALTAVVDVPEAGMIFPGSEFIGRIDETGIEVDWAVRLNVRSSEQVASKNRKALVNLNEQYSQREGELTTGQNTLDRALADLTEYVKILESDKLEVEAQATVIFATAGPTAKAAIAQARDLSNHLGSSGYRLAQPLGDQTNLWWAMMPGAPATPVVRDYAQITTSAALSATVPFASTELGDNKGMLLGINISTGRASAVLHDIAGAAASGRDSSGSIGIAGEKGAGKSLLMKTIAGSVVDRGGRIIAVDRTPMGEWAQWADAVTVSTVVDVATPKYSLDPLRLLGPEVGAQMASTFLTMLLNIDPTDPMGVLLSDVLDAGYLTEHKIESLGQLPAHLINDCTLDNASELGRLMNVFAKKKLGRVVFDPDLPMVDIATSALIIRTHGVALPTEHELLNAHLFKQMSLEKRMGRSIYALIGALARRICFSDRSVLAVYFLDECHHQTASPEGAEELIEFIRDDRKHNAAVVLGSHDPIADFGNETLRGLLPTRLALRHRDKTLAQRSLQWLGMDHRDEDLVKMMTEDTSPVAATGIVEEARRGEGFYRDTRNRIGRIKVMAPSRPDRNAAVRTTPPEAADAGLEIG